jgi:DnaJ-class molecular chaperone
VCRWDGANSPGIGFVDVLKGEGMPIFGTDHYGDLYVEYKVVFPLALSPQMRRSKSLLT